MSHSTKPNLQESLANDTVDLTYLSNMCDGDKAFIGEMVKAFISDMPKTLSGIREKIEEKDWKEVEKMAHKMKPAVQFVGLNASYEILKNVENNCRSSQDLEQIPDLLKIASANIHNAILELQAKLDNDFEEFS